MQETIVAAPMRRDGPLVCFGGANMDLHIQSSVPVVLRDSNPGRIHASPGGVMRNIAENCARLGCKPILLAAAGNDAFGDRIRKESAAAGIDISRMYMHPDCPSSCYMAFLDEEGDMLVAANDMRIVDLIPQDYLQQHEALLQQAAAILCDANPSQERIKQLARLAKDVPIFADPVSVAKGRKFQGLLDRLYLLKPNRLELQALSDMPCETKEQIQAAAQSLLERGLHAVAVSLGSEGCYYADRAGHAFFRALQPVESMVNATGAGDAFMAGLACAFVRGASPEDMIHYALACGALAVQSEDTINPRLSDEAVRRMLKERQIAI